MKNCQWIKSTPSRAEFRAKGSDAFKCGAPAAADKPYCDEHCARAYAGRSRVVRDDAYEARRAAEQSHRSRMRAAQEAA